jgi:hypothetical protein
MKAKWIFFLESLAFLSVQFELQIQKAALSCDVIFFSDHGLIQFRIFLTIKVFSGSE